PHRAHRGHRQPRRADYPVALGDPHQEGEEGEEGEGREARQGPQPPRLPRPRGRVTLAERPFGFVQVELPGELPVDDGRYPVRAAGDGDIQAVLIVATTGRAPAPRRRLRRPKPAAADPASPAAIALTTLTVVEAAPLAR